MARGRTDTGKKIWSETDPTLGLDGSKGRKSLAHILKVLEPGIVTSSRKI